MDCQTLTVKQLSVILMRVSYQNPPDPSTYSYPFLANNLETFSQ